MAEQKDEWQDVAETPKDSLAVRCVRELEEDRDALRRELAAEKEIVSNLIGEAAAAEQVARAAGDEALERAAKLADRVADDAARFIVKPASQMSGTLERERKSTAEEIAREIRALKSPPSPVAGGPGGAERSGE